LSRQGGKFRVAVPKGAIFEDALGALGAAGLPVEVLRDNGRKLIYRSGETEFIVSRPSDVPVFVEYGAADLGIVGKDVLEEQTPNVMELKDLGTGACRMILAAPSGDVAAVRESIEHAEVVRVGTKFPNTARRYFEGIGRQAEIIELHGAIELAPLVGLSDCIVDLTATGTTLRENDLDIMDDISYSTARVIANRGSYRLRNREVAGIVDAMQASEDSSPPGSGVV
jgi:ATP phosphoribosyltransferase